MKIKLLSDCVKCPTSAYEHDAGLDIYLPFAINVFPNETIVIDTKIAVQIPDGYAGLFKVRSSISKKGIVIQEPLIDSNYRGELHIIVTNCSNEIFRANKNDRICSLLIFPIFTEELEIVDELDPSERDNKCFGSSGA